MDFRNSAGRDFEIDLESGRREMIDEEGGGDDDGTGEIGQAKNTAWSGFDGSNKSEEDSGDARFEKGDDLSDGRFDEEEIVDLLDKKSRAERSRKKGSRKPSKPPRPPRAPSLDSTDHKLVQEMSDLAALKRARMERMKTLKNMKNNKGSSSGSNLCALVVTILFCLVIIWQGLFSKGTSSMKFQGSPQSTIGNREALISVQFDKNFSSAPHVSNSASPRHAASRGLKDFPVEFVTATEAAGGERQQVVRVDLLDKITPYNVAILIFLTKDQLLVRTILLLKDQDLFLPKEEDYTLRLNITFGKFKFTLECEVYL